MRAIRLLKDSSSRGFTFFELMVTVAILGCGIVFIYRSFFMSLNVIQHLSYRLYGDVLLDNKIQELQEEFYLSGTVDEASSLQAQTVQINNRPISFVFSADIKQVAKLNDLSFVYLKIMWREGNKNVQLSRQAYLYKK
ncbi:MAG: hypothetical protein A2Z88_07205 [Omnitrophica WOR_2 bacterium GWA2_47_8]|nr:MAG: hypothetical protein A2Z88_07205 [Omnitrophica WOR_2 bacterium GWA2_47_8]